MSLKTNVKKLDKSEVEIEGELGAEAFELYFDRALNKIGAEVEVDGFRKGKVPQNILLSKVPEIRILEEMAQMAIEEHYPKIIDEHKLDVIDRPEIGITKLARKNPLGFKIKTAVLPEVKLADYKKEAKEILGKITEADKNPEITEKEIEDTIMDIRKSRAPKKHIADAAEEAGHAHDPACAGGENCKHETPPDLPLSGEEKNVPPDKGEKKGVESDLPEFNDEYVKALGPFKDVADFREKLKENMKLEKQNHLREKTRLQIVEKIIEESKIDLPDVLVDLELDKIIYQMESDITMMGLKFEDYLAQIKKTKEDLRKEFRKDAEKRAKLALVLDKIAKNENIQPEKDKVDQEVAMILEHYKDADPTRARMHVENVLTNEAVFQYLEKQ